MSKDYRILIYEADAASGQALLHDFMAADCAPVWCRDATPALALIDAAAVDVAVVCLDADGVGLELLERAARSVPVLIAAPAAAVDIRMLGLSRGAVDYLIKPFGMDELSVRVATAMLRYEAACRRYVRRGGFVLDKEAGRIGDGSHWTALTSTERQAFSLLLECGDRPVSKLRLKTAITTGNITDNAIEVLIHRLRAKAQAWGMYIRTCRGEGYMLEYA